MGFVFPGGSEVQGGPQVEGTETLWKRIQIYQVRAKKMGLVIRDAGDQKAKGLG